LRTVSSAAIIDLFVNAVDNPSNVIPNKAAHAKLDLVLSSLHDSPSSLGVKDILPANNIADINLINE
jgi:hypothetical protein